MKIIRKNTFETNSSSAHSLVVTKIPEYTIKGTYGEYFCDWGISSNEPAKVNFCRQQFDLLDNWDTKLLFLLSALFVFFDKSFKEIEESTKEFKHKVLDVAEDYISEIAKKETKKGGMYYNRSYGIEVDITNNFLYNVDNVFAYFHRYYGDICGEIKFSDTLKDKFLNDKEFLKAFLFSTDSYVALGGDEYLGTYIKTIGHFFDYKTKKEEGILAERVAEYREKNNVYFVGTESKYPYGDDNVEEEICE